MKKRILFADDDPQLLAATRRMLWHTRDRWDLSFARTAAQALDILRDAPHDVAVCDLRLPDTGGRRLLKEVRRLYPWMLRIVLTGDTDQGRILQSVAVAHQFLAKPVSARQLEAVIARGCTLRDAILSEQVKARIGRIDALPAMPETFTRLVEAVEDERVPVEAVARIVAADVGLSADVLRLVNSAFFGRAGRVRDVTQAVTFLGLSAIRSLAMGVALIKAFDKATAPGMDFSLLWEHSQRTAAMARRIARMEGLSAERQEESFIAGLLHDLGKYVLALRDTQAFRALVDEARASEVALAEAEARRGGAGHAAAGAYLLGLWGLPDAVLEAVAFHHAPGAPGLSGMSPVLAVHAANSLEHDIVRIHSGYAPHPLDTEHLRSLGLEERVEDWRQECLAMRQNGEAP
ncbi:Hydrogenase transcriptional regulatory protein hupR1 [Fundidesulfovibrio magnetotacticus]|uniref:Hydrogenase transcriptional regulatory protein hupR1 n=1 Tax=Fundidesulfovibrio magnetotacticus TaxID=2730080 RepID=A0A6V8LZH5_9BACT|nr:response regulator [Fundidesulfovibrio magnetotacticus]GFK95186.1 Hydrogenase transcriptional regulatory protein hupR1 [Fundidesulfovibrio magnetotacticus]